LGGESNPLGSVPADLRPMPSTEPSLSTPSGRAQKFLGCHNGPQGFLIFDPDVTSCQKIRGSQLQHCFSASFDVFFFVKKFHFVTSFFFLTNKTQFFGKLSPIIGVLRELSSDCSFEDTRVRAICAYLVFYWHFPAVAKLSRQASSTRDILFLAIHSRIR
jgi:hypothetical protein